MVRVLVAVLFAVLAALPAMAQDDFPRIEMSLGYANLGLPCCDNVTTIGDSTRHSGFASTQGFNLTRMLGIENYFGYYSLGNRVNLLSNLIGGKVAARFERATPYFVGGIGVGYLTDSSGYYGYGSAFGTRFGPGVDLKVNDSMAWKVEFTRMSFHFGQTTPTSGTWWTGWNLSTGVVFVLSQ